MAQYGNDNVDGQTEISLDDWTDYDWQAYGVTGAGQAAVAGTDGRQSGIAQWVSGVGSSRFATRELPRQVPDYTDEDVDLDLETDSYSNRHYLAPSGYTVHEETDTSSTISTALSSCSDTLSDATTQITEPPPRRNANVPLFAGQEPVADVAHDLEALGGNPAVQALFVGLEPLHELATSPPSNSDAMSARWERESVEAQLEDLAIDLSDHQPTRSDIMPVEEAFAVHHAAYEGASTSASLSMPLGPSAGEQQYMLPCEFARLTACREQFHPDDEDGWISHIERVHLQNHFPHVCICWFCETLFDTDETRPDDHDRKKNFEMRLYHIADHFRYDQKNLGDWMPDFDLLRYLRRHHRISDGRYRQLMEFQQGPHRPRFAPPDYEHPDQIRRRERQSMEAHDQNREDRERRRRHRHR